MGRAAATPGAGELAPNFTLQTLDDRSVELKQLTAKSTVVLVVLRGWPGYQCPVCTKQVQEFIGRAGEFARRGARVLMIYPGPAEQLQAHAHEFLQNKQWPANFLFVIDPDYTFTHAYGLRWNANKETAYPSTFVIGTDGKITFAHISKSHGGRVAVAQALAELK
jgi:peroxiredoxin